MSDLPENDSFDHGMEQITEHPDYQAPSGDGPRKSRPRSGALRCGGLVGAQRATLSRTIRGQWTVWKKGTAVWARESAPGEYFIRRVRQLVDGKLSCQNEMAFVPLSALRFQRPNNKMRNAPSSEP